MKQIIRRAEVTIADAGTFTPPIKLSHLRQLVREADELGIPDDTQVYQQAFGSQVIFTVSLYDTVKPEEGKG